MQVLYEDNHIIIVNKESGEIVQGDKTGDVPLSDIVKQYIKEAHAKPGAVFLGVVIVWIVRLVAWWSLLRHQRPLPA